MSHLEFADDTLVFLDGTEEEAENLLLILQIFEAITGLSVNFKKSAVISIGADHKTQNIAEIFKCKIEKFPLKYLGMAVSAKTGDGSIWDPVIEKFQQKEKWPLGKQFFPLKLVEFFLSRHLSLVCQFITCQFSQCLQKLRRN